MASIEFSSKNYQLKYDNRFLIEYGSLNRKNPDVVFINYKTYLESNSENEDNKIIINCILRKIKRKVANIVSNSRFKGKYIFDYDILQDIQPTFKNKILTFELFLKQPKDEIIKMSKLKPHLETLSKILTDTLSEELQLNEINLSKVKS